MQRNRLFWGSRRGMLELDLMLLPFLETGFPDLSAEDQACYERLLECEDQELFAWLLHRERPEDPDLQRIVDLVREHARNRRD